MRRFAPNLVEMLRSTLRKLQESIDLDPHDPALRGLKSALLRDLAELEMSRSHPRPIRVVQIMSAPQHSPQTHTRGVSRRWKDEDETAA